MKNEPVAWMQTWANQDNELKHTVNIEQIGKQDIPLYTHPAKTLTDEEIEELARKMGMNLYDYEIDPLGNCLNFARAILRKASEK